MPEMSVSLPVQLTFSPDDVIAFLREWNGAASKVDAEKSIRESLGVHPDDPLTDDHYTRMVKNVIEPNDHLNQYWTPYLKPVAPVAPAAPAPAPARAPLPVVNNSNAVVGAEARIAQHGNRMGTYNKQPVYVDPDTGKARTDDDEDGLVLVTMILRPDVEKYAGYKKEHLPPSTFVLPNNEYTQLQHATHMVFPADKPSPFAHPLGMKKSVTLTADDNPRAISAHLRQKTNNEAPAWVASTLHPVGSSSTGAGGGWWSSKSTPTSQLDKLELELSQPDTRAAIRELSRSEFSDADFLHRRLQLVLPALRNAPTDEDATVAWKMLMDTFDSSDAPGLRRLVALIRPHTEEEKTTFTQGQRLQERNRLGAVAKLSTAKASTVKENAAEIERLLQQPQTKKDLTRYDTVATWVRTEGRGVADPAGRLTHIQQVLAAIKTGANPYYLFPLIWLDVKEYRAVIGKSESLQRITEITRPYCNGWTHLPGYNPGEHEPTIEQTMNRLNFSDETQTGHSIYSTTEKKVTRRKEGKGKTAWR